MQRSSAPDLYTDLSGARRVIGRMQARGIIDQSDADEIRQKFRQLNQSATAPTGVSRPQVAPAAAEPAAAPLPSDSTAPSQSPIPVPKEQADRAASSGPPIEETPVLAELAPEVFSRPLDASEAPAQSSVPTTATSRAGVSANSTSERFAITTMGAAPHTTLGLGMPAREGQHSSHNHTSELPCRRPR